MDNIDPTGAFGLGDLLGGFEKYVETPLLGAAFTVGSFGVFATCAGAIGWTGVGIAACGLGATAMLSVGLSFDYVAYREFSGHG
jgi:hypothetical protein